MLTVTPERKNEIYALVSGVISALKTVEEIAIAVDATSKILSESPLNPHRGEAAAAPLGFKEAFHAGFHAGSGGRFGGPGAPVTARPSPWIPLDPSRVADDEPILCEEMGCSALAAWEWPLAEDAGLVMFACAEHRPAVQHGVEMVLASGWEPYIPSMQPPCPCMFPGCSEDEDGGSADACWKRACLACGSNVFRCGAHLELFADVGAADVSGENETIDLDRMRYERAIPVVQDIARRLAEADSAIDDAQAHASSVRQEMHAKLRDLILPMIRQADDPIIQALQQVLPDRNDIIHTIVEAALWGVDGFSHAFDEISERKRPGVFVRCDDFGTADDEHYVAVQEVASSRPAWPSQAELLLAMNERLKLCKRPAQAFHAEGPPEKITYDVCEHDHDGEPAS